MLQMEKCDFCVLSNQTYQPDFIGIAKSVSGVLASFVLLLSTVVSEQRDLNTTSDDNNHTLSSQEEPDSVLIMNLPFVKNLTDPCSWGRSYNGPSHITSKVIRDKFTEEFFTLVRHYSRIYKEDFQALLRNHAIKNCAGYGVGVANLPDTPTLAELQEMDKAEAFNKIYLSLLVHSAYSFVIHYQVGSNNVRCSDDIQGEQSLASQSFTMARKLKSLACNVLIGMTVLGYEKENVASLLNVKVSDLTICSRRAMRDCQIMNSAQRFLQDVHSFAVKDLTKTSTSLHNSVSSTVSTVPTPSTTPSSTTLISSTAFTSSFISTPSSTTLTSTATSRLSTASTSSIISTLLSTSSSFKSTTPSARTTE